MWSGIVWDTTENKAATSAVDIYMKHALSIDAEQDS